MSAKKIWALAVGVFSTLLLLNFGMGVAFEIPDNLPIVGNLDEAAATLLLVWSIKELFGKGGGASPTSSPSKPPEKTVN